MVTEVRPLASYLSEIAPRVESVSEEDLTKLLDAFRSLRKGCASSKEYQTAAGHVLTDMSVILLWLHGAGKDDLVNIGLQAIGNMIVQHADNQAKAWDIMGSFIRKLVKSENKKILYVVSMVLYNVLLGVSENLTLVDASDILQDVLPFEDDAPEFIVFTVELLVTLEVTEVVYDRLDKECKVHLLDTIYNMILEEEKSSSKRPVPVSTMLFLVEQFKQRNFYILKTSDKYADLLEPCEVSKLLDIIAAASSRDIYLQHLQKDRSLLIDCTYVLRSVHMAGKAGTPGHEPLTQLSDFSNQIGPNAATAGASAEVTDSPTFSFKSRLIRLLGNLCWKNKENQDEVREMDGIPLLLDCCHIDARNPLLIQWVVLAVRNLCEANLENQAVIASMNREGVVESRVMHELGITLNEDEDGNTIRVVPLKK